ncbi:hypothetical protein LguiB_010509 [Lonicera macranthoides]
MVMAGINGGGKGRPESFSIFINGGGRNQWWRWLEKVPLEPVQVFDLNGNAILLSDSWEDIKAVVAFARHFGYFYYPPQKNSMSKQTSKETNSEQ